MQQQDTLFSVGRKVGRLEREVELIKEEIASFRTLAFRVVVLVALWGGVIGGGLSRNEIAELLAQILRRLVGIGG